MKMPLLLYGEAFGKWILCLLDKDILELIDTKGGNEESTGALVGTMLDDLNSR